MMGIMGKGLKNFIERKQQRTLRTVESPIRIPKPTIVTKKSGKGLLPLKLFYSVRLQTNISFTRVGVVLGPARLKS
jgi:hypothetical protein